MSSKRFLTSIVLQRERASCSPLLRHRPTITSPRTAYGAAALTFPPRNHLRQLTTTTTRRRQLQEPPPPPPSSSSSTTATTNTSSADPNKAASAESTTTASSSTTTTPSPSSSESSKIYTYEDMQRLTSSPSSSPSSPHPNPNPSLIVIDVREPAELAATGHIPTARNVPITSSPDAFFLPETEFEERFGFARPPPDAEVVFYCKSGVRSRAAARLAAQAGFGGSRAEFPGSWMEWEARGGRVERG